MSKPELTQQQQEILSKVSGCISSLFNEDNEHYIDLEDENLDVTYMFHAISTMVPALLYNRICSGNEDNLSFNHLMNRLCFQFDNKSDEE